MLEHIKNFAELFLEKSHNKNIQLIGHFDTDGITSTAILTKTLERLGKSFSTKIVKQFSSEEIKKISRDKIVLIVDLASASLKELSGIDNTIFILDHHEIKSYHEMDSQKITLCNPHLYDDYQDICSSELAYLFSTTISPDNKDLAHLAILGMVGDTMEKNINKIRNQIIKDAGVQVKKGLLIYPSTRPLDRTLEYSARPFIPGITGNRNNILELLKDAGIQKIGKQYKSLIDLNEDEMKQLTTAIMLRLSGKEASEHIGNLYLIKFFNKIEDARELSAIINACSRMDRTDIALLVCLGNNDARSKAERIYLKYRQHILSGLKYIEKNERNNILKGEEYIIINAQQNIKDTIIGTLASILSFSSVYKEGTIIVAMAYNQNKIKVSTRVAGKTKKSDRNLKEFLESITTILGKGESGGHKYAAGCTIDMEDEQRFIELVQKKLEYEMVRV